MEQEICRRPTALVRFVRLKRQQALAEWELRQFMRGDTLGIENLTTPVTTQEIDFRIGRQIRIAAGLWRSHGVQRLSPPWLDFIVHHWETVNSLMIRRGTTTSGIAG